MSSTHRLAAITVPLAIRGLSAAEFSRLRVARELGLPLVPHELLSALATYRLDTITLSQFGDSARVTARGPDATITFAMVRIPGGTDAWLFERSKVGMTGKNGTPR